MTYQLRVSAVACLGAALTLASTTSFALGFGRPVSQAVLGESLSLTVPLRLEASEELTTECVSADVLFGDERVSPSAVVVSLSGTSPTERQLRVTTTRLVHEPVVTVHVKAGCEASMTRKFVVLADPPDMTPPQVASMVTTSPVVVTAAPSGATKSAEVPTSPADRVATSSSPSRPAAVAATRPATPSAAVAAPPRPQAERAAPARPATKPAVAAATASPPPTPRLMLDPASADAAVMPELRLSTTMGVSPAVEAADSAEVLARREAAGALWRAMNAQPEELVAEQQRVRELEQRLAQLNADSQQARQSVQTMQTRLQELEGPARHSVWTYVLGVIALAAAALAVFFYRQSRQRQTGQDTAWWQSQVDDAAAEAAADMASEMGGQTSADFVRRAEPLDADAGAVPAPAATSSASASAPGAPSAPSAAAPSAAAAPVVPSTAVEQAKVASAPVMAAAAPAVELASAALLHEAQRAVTVEELIDLEQQADFFVVLGQDDAALDLLEHHTMGGASASPLPYLKLLEIYQRLGKRGEYERVQQVFNQRFNAYAPAWESDLQHGHSLEDYPGVIERLQALWTTPSRAMDVLERSLTRPDDQVETFDLPAYRELLILYAVARDLAEREQQFDAVDLLLPVTESPTLGDEAHDEVEPLMATRPIKAQPDARPDFTLDLHLDDLDGPAAGSASSTSSAAFTTRPLAAVSEHEHIDLPDVNLDQRR
ncbi:MAG: FimV family protein [Aquabacterium sp.]